MKIVWQIFCRDLRRVTHNLIALIVVVGMCFIPALYAWFNIEANIDPYNNLANIKVAVVNEDLGASNEQTGDVHLGKDVMSNLRKNKKLGWTFVSKRDAIEGVRSGDYYAALVIPEDFSSSITSILSGTIKRPRIDYYINEKKNAIAPKVTDTAAASVQTEINTTFVGVVSEVVTEKINEMGGNILGGVNSAALDLTQKLDAADQKLARYEQLVDSFRGDYGVNQKNLQKTYASLDKIDSAAAAGLKDLDETDRLLQEARESTAEYINSLNTQVTDAQEVIDKTKTDAAGASGGNISQLSDLYDQLAANDEALNKIRDQYLNTTLPDVNKALDALSAASGTMRGTLTSVPNSTNSMRAALHELDNCLKDTDKALANTKTSIAGVRASLAAARADLETLLSSDAYQKLMSMTDLDADDVSDFLASPIKLETRGYFKVKNYGSAMTPFYTNLAMWIAGIVLASVIKLRTDSDEEIPEFTARQSYFGRWMLYVFLGLIMGIIAMLGDLFLLKVQCLHPMAFLLAGMVTSFVYVNIIFALAITFNHIGRALCVLLIILQIPGSSGTYPIEMMPGFFRILHPLLPFTYSIDAMREAIAGYYDGYYWKNLMILQIFLIISLFIGLVIQPIAMNLDNLFDDRLARTGLMISERENPLEGRFNLNHMLWVLTEEKSTKEVVMQKALRFEEKYPMKIRRGLLLFGGLPTIFLLLAFAGLNQKLLFIILWVVSLVVIAIYLIVIEYIHDSLVQRLGLTEVPQEELISRVQEIRNRIRNRRSGMDAEGIAKEINEVYDIDVRKGMTSNAQNAAQNAAQSDGMSTSSAPITRGEQRDAVTSVNSAEQRDVHNNAQSNAHSDVHNNAQTIVQTKGIRELNEHFEFNGFEELGKSNEHNAINGNSSSNGLAGEGGGSDA